MPATRMFIGSRLMAVYSFDYWDPSRPSLFFFLEYASLVAIRVATAHWTAKSLKRRTAAIGRSRRGGETSFIGPTVN